jgi:hypothetical protein
VPFRQLSLAVATSNESVGARNVASVSCLIICLYFVEQDDSDIMDTKSHNGPCVLIFRCVPVVPNLGTHDFDGTHFVRSTEIDWRF